MVMMQIVPSNLLLRTMEDWWEMAILIGRYGADV